MNRLVFEVQAPVIAADPNRADIACFVGFVARRKNTAVPPPVLRWLQEQDWIYPVRNQLKQTEYKLRYQVTGEVTDLLDIPVPIDSWEVFDHLFEWERRVLSRRIERNPSNTSSVESSESEDDRIIERFSATYLGAAVRSFFAQGGRKCYVVRVGDPWIYETVLPRELSLDAVAAAADEEAEKAAQKAAESAASQNLEKAKQEEAKQEAREEARRKVIDLAIGQIRQHGRCRRLCFIGRLIPGFQLPGECFSESLPPDALADLARPESSRLIKPVGGALVISSACRTFLFFVYLISQMQFGSTANRSSRSHLQRKTTRSSSNVPRVKQPLRAIEAPAFFARHGVTIRATTSGRRRCDSPQI